MQISPALHRLLFGCALGLLIVFTLPLFLATNASVGFWLMQCVPLLLTLPGLHKHQPRALQWLGFLVLFYFLNGVLQAASAAPLQRWLGALTVLLCVTLFAAVIVAVRGGRRARHDQHTE
ncbi:MAG: DUF2069 domain-containing protein [Pseudomonadota bacterium]|nr:DUF2069 domain-containing protein [Pseudomonadota bacterium]